MTFDRGQAVAIMGATATGKSQLAIRLAERFGGEIVSMDSRQVYRGLDIGTGKVPPNERNRVPHHLIDILEPDEPNSAGGHVSRARDAMREITARGRIPLLVGGTGLYFRALFHGLIEPDVDEAELRGVRSRLSKRPTTDLYRELAECDPDRAGVLSPNDRMRILRSLEIFHASGKTHSKHIRDQPLPPAWTGLKIVLTLPRDELRRRIAERTRAMFRAGWCDEVRRLLESGVRLEAPGMRSLGYALIGEGILRGGDPEGTLEAVITQTQQYAKRQETFFRSEKDAHWIDVSRRGFAGRVETLVGRRAKL